MRTGAGVLRCRGILAVVTARFACWWSAVLRGASLDQTIPQVATPDTGVRFAGVPGVKRKRRAVEQAYAGAGQPQHQVAGAVSMTWPPPPMR